MGACQSATCMTFPYVTEMETLSDEFLVIKDSGLLPTEYAEPADYKGVKPEKLERDSTVIDICNFFVEYMQSDVVVCFFMIAAHMGSH